MGIVGEPRLRVVVVDEEFPFPANSGKRIRTLNLMSRLAAFHDITFVAHRNADASELKEAIGHFEGLGIRTIEVPRQITPKSGPTFYLKLAVNLFSSLPYSVSSHLSEEMKSRLEQLNEEGDVQVWHCEWSPYAELFRNLALAPLVVAAHNVESLIWKRYVETESNFVKRWYIRKQWKKFERFERWAFSRADRTIAVSGEDGKLAERDFGATNIVVVQNGVDVAKYACNGTVRNNNEMIFLGSLDWRPNLDGIERFLDTAFQKVVSAEPEVKLNIVGRNPPQWLVERADSDPNVELFANVPEVIPFLSKAGIMVVPLRVGGGSRLKIIEAAANGLPVVSTRIGAEGLKFQPGIDYFLAEDIDSMDVPILAALRDPKGSRLAASNALKIAEQEYDWDALAREQAAVWRSVADSN